MIQQQLGISSGNKLSEVLVAAACELSLLRKYLSCCLALFSGTNANGRSYAIAIFSFCVSSMFDFLFWHFFLHFFFPSTSLYIREMRHDSQYMKELCQEWNNTPRRRIFTSEFALRININFISFYYFSFIIFLVKEKMLKKNYIELYWELYYREVFF